MRGEGAEIMSLLIDLAGGVIKAVGGARTASRAVGLDTPALEELHDGLSPVRAQYMHARAHDLAANAGASQAAQPTDPAGVGDGDPADTGDGFISDVIEWFTDLFS
jgi:hypothetical protein